MNQINKPKPFFPKLRIKYFQFSEEVRFSDIRPHIFWYKCEYDSNGKEIYVVNSSGAWERKEYNENGIRVYYENSEGVIRDNR